MYSGGGGGGASSDSEADLVSVVITTDYTLRSDLFNKLFVVLASFKATTLRRFLYKFSYAPKLTI